MIPQQEKLWMMLGLMMVAPFILVMVLPDPYGTVATIVVNLGMLFYIRKFYKGVTSSIMGNKTGLVCSACNFSKSNRDGSCKRCGCKNKRLG